MLISNFENRSYTCDLVQLKSTLWSTLEIKAHLNYVLFCTFKKTRTKIISHLSVFFGFFR